MVLGLLLLSGVTSAHLVPGDPPHIDIEAGPYVAGETLTLRLFVSNPTTAWANYTWWDGCVLRGFVASERRILAAWPSGPVELCTMAVVNLWIPPNSSVLWYVFDFDTLPDDGCVDAWISLRNYPVWGEAHVCPGPAEPEPEPSEMELVVSVPSVVGAGEAFDVSSTVRTTRGEPLEGILVTVSLGGAEIGAATTGADGRVAMTARAPDAGNTILTPLTVRASGEGRQDVSRTRMITVFPATSERLVLRPSLVTGDLIAGGGFAVLEVLVFGSGDKPVAEVSLDLEVAPPLAVEERRDLGGNRYVLTLRAWDVSEGGVASVRLVANAPGFDGAEAVLDYVIIPVIPGMPNQPPSARDEPVPVAVLAGLGIAAIAAAGLGVWHARRRSRRREHAAQRR